MHPKHIKKLHRLRGIEKKSFHPLQHHIHRKHNISKKTIFYMKEYGPHTNVSRTIIRESIKILVLASVISAIGGFALENVREKVVLFTPLLVMLPVLNGMTGNYGIIISSKFSTMLHEGKVNGHELLGKCLIRLMGQVMLIATITASLSTAASLAISGYTMTGSVAALKMFFIVIADALLLISILFAVSIIAGPRAALLAVSGIAISMLSAAAFAVFILNWSFINGLLLGAIVGGTSSSIVMPIVNRLKTNDKISTMLSLESVFTDAFVVVMGITLLQLMTTVPNGNEATILAGGIASQFSIGIFIGMVSGVVWLSALKVIQGQLYDDITTLATVLLLFAIVEMLGGNGAIFALTFGLILGNGKEIARMLKIKQNVEAGSIMKKFHSQISFFIRTFFFVYLGLIISFGNAAFFAFGVVLAFILLGGRYLAALLACHGNPLFSTNIKTITFMLPRGLAAAIMAQLVATSGIPGSDVYSDIIIGVIVTTVLIASFGIMFLENKNSGISDMPREKIQRNPDPRSS